MAITSIHQFSFACGNGAGVTNGMFYTQKILRELGFASDIYSSSIPTDLQHLVNPVTQFKSDEHTLLMLHHCLGYDHPEAVLALPVSKLMVYHNITPPEFLPAGSEIQSYAILGREQLKNWADLFIGAIGDSELNSEELRACDYPNVTTIPLLLDLDRWSGMVPDFEGLPSQRDAYQFLFVGRICENKNQLELVEAFHLLKQRSPHPIHLNLVGEVTSGTYQDAISRRIHELDLCEHVSLVGQVSTERLLAYYKRADAFVCLSAHEGFGMPLIEAMRFDVPVVARDSSSIASTLGGAGLLMASHSNFAEMAGAMFSLMTEKSLRRDILRRQRQRMASFSKANVSLRLKEYLRQLGIVSPALASLNGEVSPESKRMRWQVEGPFDSSYSLAIVNRELALALDRNWLDVALRSHEGQGDFKPSAQFLSHHDECRRLFEKAQAAAQTHYAPDIALRFCYPPHTDEMPATLRMMHSYGWEETGFPPQYVEEFNRNLDMVSVLSHSVAKNLRDSGVRIPIVVTGAGVDHLLTQQENKHPNWNTDALKSFRFLHISSCFPRKGVDVLLQAFGEVFSIDDDVCLVIKTFSNPHNTVANQLAQHQRENPGFPQVHLIVEDWHDAQIKQLYRDCHTYVAPSRGEGFGLPMAEAMLFDLPVITTRWGGQTDFCAEETAWCCDYQFAKAEAHFGLTHSLWAEPDVQHLGRLMQAMTGMDAGVKNLKVAQAKQRVLQEFTWEKTAEKLQAAVTNLSAQSSLSKQPKIAWISTWNARCGIANYSYFLTQNIPASRLTILANHIPERTGLDGSNVLRCWNAELDENLDYVVDEIVERQIEAVVFQYNFGFCSTENLGHFLESLAEHKIATYLFFHSTADVQASDRRISLGTIKDCLRLATRIFVHNVDDMNRLKAWDLVENVVYFPHGIAPPPALASVKSEFFADKTVIASYGFLLPHKGIRQLLLAFFELCVHSDSLHLLLVNSLYPSPLSDEELRACRQLIDESGLRHKVTFQTDFLSDEQTHVLLSNADLIVYPYQETQESSSAAVRVGLSTGKPVAVTPLKIFDDVAEAVHVLPGTDVAALVQGMTALLNAENSQAQANRSNWFQERGWPTLSSRLLNIIDGCAEDSADL